MGEILAAISIGAFVGWLIYYLFRPAQLVARADDWEKPVLQAGADMRPIRDLPESALADLRWEASRVLNGGCCSVAHFTRLTNSEPTTMWWQR